MSHVCYILLYAIGVYRVLAIDTSRHRGRCADKWQEQVRAGNCSVQRRGSKSRSSLQCAEMIYYVTQSPRGSSTFWHGVKVDRPPEVT